ncbi:hypothetical protein [Kribbella swartbergensis]
MILAVAPWASTIAGFAFRFLMPATTPFSTPPGTTNGITDDFLVFGSAYTVKSPAFASVASEPGETPIAICPVGGVVRLVQHPVAAPARAEDCGEVRGHLGELRSLGRIEPLEQHPAGLHVGDGDDVLAVQPDRHRGGHGRGGDSRSRGRDGPGFALAGDVPAGDPGDAGGERRLSGHARGNGVSVVLEVPLDADGRRRDEHLWWVEDGRRRTDRSRSGVGLVCVTPGATPEHHQGRGGGDCPDRRRTQLHSCSPQPN